MAKNLTVSDFDPGIKAKISTQAYGTAKTIDGVKIVTLKTYAGEDGDFSELLRLNDKSESTEFPGFKPRQINRSKLIGGGVKAWHLHFRQDEIWYSLPPGELLLGLWDIRNDSPTKGLMMRIALNGSKLVFIPRGVAHGATNLGHEPTNILYFVTEQFNPDDPDEHRLPWDAAGADFWLPKRE